MAAASPLTSTAAPVVELRDAVVATKMGVRCAPVDLRLSPGERVVVGGLAGSGKSQLLRAVVGLTPLVAGALRLFGEETAAFVHDDWMRIRRRVVLASESAPLLSNLSVRDNLALPLVVRGEREAHARGQVDAALGHHGLAAVADLRPHVLAGAQHRQLLLLRALLLPCDLMVLDGMPLREEAADEAPSPWVEALEHKARQGAAVLASAIDPLQLPGFRCLRVEPA